PRVAAGALEVDMDMANVQLGGRAWRKNEWPPKKSEHKASISVDDKGGAPITAVHQWPFYEIPIEDVPILDGPFDKDTLKLYKVMDMSDSVLKAFMLSNRWNMNNARRSAGFDRKGIAALSSARVVVPALNRIFNGLGAWRTWRSEAPDRADTRESFDEFAAEKGADEDTAAELRAILFGDDQATAALRITALVGTQRGAALALWALEPDSSSVRLDFCVGEDCLAEGPEVEMLLMRLVASEAREQGAKRLRCRARQTEEGKLFPPKSFKTLGLTATPAATAGFEIDLGDDAEEADWSVPKDMEDDEEQWMKVVRIREAVPGVRDWLR
ncbi:unnamed protein product, partial [Prorocentrum cordatum]